MIPTKTPVVPSPAALALGRAILPPGARLGGMTPSHFPGLYDFLAEEDAALPHLVDAGCRLLDNLAVVQAGRRFQRLSHERQQALARRWLVDPGPLGAAFAGLSALVKLYYFEQPEVFEAYGVPYDKAPKTPEPEPRYMRQAMAGYEAADQGELEAEVVVIGSGAAGAFVAKELAQRGHAVLLVEAGRYFRRPDFNGRYVNAARNLYHWQARNYVVGNCLLFLPTGRTVGGSTTVNTATCFRPPAWVHRRWQREGLSMLSEEAMAPYFDEVEATMQVAPTPRDLWGKHVSYMSEVLDRRGLSHGPIQRNAPDCDGQNACDFGCPSGGKFSQDLACVPLALRHGAMLLTETELQRIHLRHRRVQGVTLRSGGRAIRVRAPELVLACGTLITPEILWNHGLGGPLVGRNLTVQPSCSVSARLDRPVDGHAVVVPSSHYIDQFQDRRLMLISANMPLDMGAMPLQLVGDELTREMERYDRFGTWGVLLAETSRGRLRRLPGGTVISEYFMNRADADLLHWGVAFNIEMYLQAGAEACFPAVRGFGPIRNRAELERFRRARIQPRDYLMTAYHPLGTCRMGVDPATSVVDPEYRLRGVHGLHVVDGSVVPGPLGINSQLTVMAFARRAADIINDTLEGSP